MPKRWQPTPQEIELIVDMLEAGRPKAAIAKYLFVSESTLRRWLARASGAANVVTLRESA